MLKSAADEIKSRVTGVHKACISFFAIKWFKTQFEAFWLSCGRGDEVTVALLLRSLR